MQLSTDNVMDLSLDEIRDICFGSIPTHEKSLTIDPQEYVTLLGQYPALYQYFSEILKNCATNVILYLILPHFQALLLKDMI